MRGYSFRVGGVQRRCPWQTEPRAQRCRGTGAGPTGEGDGHNPSQEQTQKLGFPSYQCDHLTDRTKGKEFIPEAQLDLALVQSCASALTATGVTPAAAVLRIHSPVAHPPSPAQESPHILVISAVPSSDSSSKITETKLLLQETVRLEPMQGSWRCTGPGDAARCTRGSGG